MNKQVGVWVNREDFHRVRVHDSGPGDGLHAGQVLLAIDRFALTANNITYAAAGERLGFWRYFPAPAPWGCIPVWGFADVIASRHAQIAVGERVFGFLPMASHVVFVPGRVTTSGFVDEAPHRAALLPTYNHYARWPAGAALDPRHEDRHAVIRPLFFTSFVLDDQLADAAYFGVASVLLSSASSKTALGTAFLLRERHAVRVCGLTSPRHRGFVAASGCFDAVYGYDELEALALEPPVAYVDFSGDAAVRRAVHARLGPDLVRSLAVGATHWAELTEHETPRGVAVEAFSGTEQIRKRRSEWGSDALHGRLGAAEARFLAAAAAWLQIERRHGLTQVERAYRELLQGRVAPECAFVCALAPPEATPREEGAALAFLRTGLE
jgi:hypothetical protein